MAYPRKLDGHPEDAHARAFPMHARLTLTPSDAARNTAGRRIHGHGDATGRGRNESLA